MVQGGKEAEGISCNISVARKIQKCTCSFRICGKRSVGGRIIGEKGFFCKHSVGNPSEKEKEGFLGNCLIKLIGCQKLAGKGGEDTFFALFLAFKGQRGGEAPE